MKEKKKRERSKKKEKTPHNTVANKEEEFKF